MKIRSVRHNNRKKVFDGLTVGVRGGTATVRPQSVRVALTGPESVLGRLSADAVRPYVDVTKVSENGRAPVVVELGPGHAGVTVEGTDPAEVLVRIPGPAVKK